MSPTAISIIITLGVIDIILAVLLICKIISDCNCQSGAIMLKEQYNRLITGLAKDKLSPISYNKYILCINRKELYCLWETLTLTRDALTENLNESIIDNEEELEHQEEWKNISTRLLAVLEGVVGGSDEHTKI